MKVEPVTLEGNRVRMEPLSRVHLDDLCAVGLDEELWRLIPTFVKSRDDMRAYIETALAEQERGVSLPFATVVKKNGKAVGSTRFGNISAENLRVEIGWTWIAREWQRSFVNTEAKYLMLRHAFEVWKCNRVELKTDALNERSRKAILRIGAMEEGIFRQHMVTETGRLRDTVYFSILDNEWEIVKNNLAKKIEEF
jgi:RimJ/RimL family protein N-acetyltransferase